MKEKILIGLLLFMSTFSFSQAQKLLKGNVKNDNFPLQGIEIINQTSQQISKTDANGNFSIEVKDNDLVVFYGEEYLSYRINVNQEILSKKTIEIFLEKKVIQIDEVIIEREDKWSTDYMQKIMDKRYISDGQSSVPNNLVYDGQTLGVDFIKVGKLVGKLLKNKDKGRKEMPALGFNDFVTANFNQKFFEENLQIKPEEMLLFLEFCESDPKSKSISAHNNTLGTMDFLIAKNGEFKKINKILNQSKP